MNISTAPIWVSALFIIGLVFVPILIARAVRKAALNAGFDPRKQQKISYGIYAFYGIIGIYASILSLSGFLTIITRPPRAIVFLTLPILLFFILFTRTRLYKTLVEYIDIRDLIMIQIFRLVGFVFIVLYLLNYLSATFALRAGPGDVITAVASIPIAYFVFTTKKWNILMAYLWNIFGLADILLVVGTAIYLNNTTPTSISELALFPYGLVAAFAPPTPPL